MKHRVFIKNAAILTVTSLILRTVGIFFRVWMTRTIGAEGMGLYGLIVSVYVLGSTFATTGICTAVTRLVSELPTGSAQISKVMKRATALTLIIATVSAALIYFLAEPICRYLLFDMRAVKAIKILVLSLPFMGLSSIMRGYFIGVRKTSFPSISQLLEQLVRMAFIVWLVTLTAHKGLAYTSAAILLGDGLGEAAGCGLLYVFYKNERKKTPKEKAKNLPVTHKLLNIAVPITAGRYIHTLLRTVENLIIPLRLSVFSNDKTKSLEQFGMIKGMAIPLLFFPASFLTAFSTLMIPEISEAMAAGRLSTVRRVTDKSISITAQAATLIGGIFFVCGGDIASLLYNSTDTGILIRSLAPLVPFMYLESVCDGILKGLDQQKHSFYYGIIDSGSRIILIWFIVAARGMQGFLLIMVYSNLLTSLLNLRRLLKVTKTRTKTLRWVIFPSVFIVLSCALGLLATQAIDGTILRIAVGGGITATVYLMLMYFTGQLNY